MKIYVAKYVANLQMQRYIRKIDRQRGLMGRKAKGSIPKANWLGKVTKRRQTETVVESMLRIILALLSNTVIWQIILALLSNFKSK